MNEFVTLLILAGALGTDATSMALGMGMNGVEPGEISKTSITVGIFHIFMPLAGLSLGRTFGTIAGNIAGLIGAFILVIIGIIMVKEALSNNKKGIPSANCIKGWGLGVLALSVSLDSFSVGFSLGTFSKLRTSTTVITIGIVAALMTAAGLLLGKRVGKALGDKAEIAGGIVLVLIGVKMLL
ncbi:MAG: manganese efflux pump [Firmicutes bacterium]|nr:manganese efflux pump [Bacillota bacterium]